MPAEFPTHLITRAKAFVTEILGHEDDVASVKLATEFFRINEEAKDDKHILWHEKTLHKIHAAYEKQQKERSGREHAKIASRIRSLTSLETGDFVQCKKDGRHYVVTAFDTEGGALHLCAAHVDDSLDTTRLEASQFEFVARPEMSPTPEFGHELRALISEIHQFFSKQPIEAVKKHEREIRDVGELMLLSYRELNDRHMTTVRSMTDDMMKVVGSFVERSSALSKFLDQETEFVFALRECLLAAQRLSANLTVLGDPEETVCDRPAIVEAARVGCQGLVSALNEIVAAVDGDDSVPDGESRSEIDPVRRESQRRFRSPYQGSLTLTQPGQTIDLSSARGPLREPNVGQIVLYTARERSSLERPLVFPAIVTYVENAKNVTIAVYVPPRLVESLEFEGLHDLGFAGQLAHRTVAAAQETGGVVFVSVSRTDSPAGSQGSEGHWSSSSEV